jgi:hypothetical protein
MLRKITWWLKKYAGWIAITQSIVWPLTIVGGMYYNYNNDFVYMGKMDAVAYSVLWEWHMSSRYGYRSKDECIEFKIALYDDVSDCDELDTEGQQIAAALKLHGVDDLSETDYDWLTFILYSYNIPDSVQELLQDTK